jgi:UDP-N-acetylglucosamine:LPS N-acetylglucosamine transferase
MSAPSDHHSQPSRRRPHFLFRCRSHTAGHASGKLRRGTFACGRPVPVVPKYKLVKQLDFIYFDAGGGHRAAASALRQVIEQQGRPWQVRMVHLQEQLDRLDVFRRLTGLRLEDCYNLLLKKGWTLGSPAMTRGMQLVIRAFHRQQVAELRKFWERSRPDMVVSLVPNFNRALGESLSAALPAVPLVTILTDLADFPPHFWLEPVPQYIVCGSDHAVEQALAMGHPRERIFRVSGMILNPSFYAVRPLSSEEREARRAEAGFDPKLPVGLVMFGGQGSAAMPDIAKRLPDRQLLLICGHNDKLASALRALRRPAPLHVIGFTQEVPAFMQLADYFIGKPGPGSMSEAVHMGLPVIVESNAWTLPQERYNGVWVKQMGIGTVLRNFRGIAGAVAETLDPANYERLRAATARIHNRAVFEIADLLEKLIP